MMRFKLPECLKGSGYIARWGGLVAFVMIAATVGPNLIP